MERVGGLFGIQVCQVELGVEILTCLLFSMKYYPGPNTSTAGFIAFH